MMRVNASVDCASRIEFGPEPYGHRPRRIPKLRTSERPRQKWPTCPVSGKRQFTEIAAQQHLEAIKVVGRDRNSAHLRKLRNKRAYLCDDCGDWHLTSMVNTPKHARR